MVALVAASVPRAATAQEVDLPVPRSQVQCNGQVINEILVRSYGPSYGGLFSRSPWLGRLVTSLQVTTAPDVVENLVLLRRGERCSILLRRETERLLRAQPFLADASVTAYPDGSDAVRVEVVTIDEPSVIGSIGVSSASPWLRAIKYGSDNVQGKAITALAGWRDGRYYRDTYQAAYTNWQLFAAPVQMHLRAIRREHGFETNAQVTYPFFTDLQPRAWRVAGGADDILVPFRSPGREPAALGVRRQFVEVGSVARLGEPGLLAILGGAISAERARPDAAGVVVTDTGLVADTGSALLARYPAYRSTRLNLLLGYRQVNFLRVTGFDALAGSQDVRRGVQLALTLGRGLPVEGAIPGEVFLSASLYGGVGSPTSFAGLEALAEGRRVNGDWESLLLGGRFGFYLRPHPRHTIAGSLEYGAGRRQWQPFQLALGDVRGGVRGYDDAELGGAARLVARLEERWRVGNIRGTADAGVALFAEAGRLWAGDAPYGQSTGYKPSIGVAFLSAVPPRSRRIWRFDVAVPLQRDAGARWVMRITNEDRTRAFWVEPNDIRRNRERSGLVTAFVVP
ncbi:MAG TPA: hypothetical protein VF981_17225 [Gemmatimonadaceae bacterium]